MKFIVLATEDELSETIALQILARFPALQVEAALGRKGNGYLRSRMRNFSEMARQRPVLVLTDLDTALCPVELRKNWLRRIPNSQGLFLRIVEREIEAWLLADHDAIRVLFGTSVRPRLPDHPDKLADPKQFLLDLARRAPKNVRLDLRAEQGAFARQGIGYNARLCDLVRTAWHPERAAARSPSLHRTLGRVRELSLTEHL